MKKNIQKFLIHLIIGKIIGLKENKNTKIPIRIFTVWIFEKWFFKQYDDKTINSIYFDDKYSSFFKSNLDGDFLRIKPRLRWYGKDLQNVNHEFKIKKGFVGIKIINKEILKNISQKDKILEKCNEYHSKAFQLQLNVSSSIKYVRSYFIHPSRIRLTIDREIFSKQASASNFINMPFEVIEFKYKPELDTFLEKIYSQSSTEFLLEWPNVQSILNHDDLIYFLLFNWNMFVFGLQAYINDKFIQNKVELKSPKKEPLGKIGKKFIIK